MSDKHRIIFSVTVSSLVVGIFVAVITVAADLYLPLKDWLKNVFSHHWVGKGVLAAGLFLIGVPIVYAGAKKADEKLTAQGLVALYWISCISSAIIFLFFVYEAILK